jgi:hypothetical protein
MFTRSTPCRQLKKGVVQLLIVAPQLRPFAFSNVSSKSSRKQRFAHALKPLELLLLVGELAAAELT